MRVVRLSMVIIALLGLAAVTTSFGFRQTQETELQRMGAAYEHNLIRQAERGGLWDSSRYPLNRTLNPYYLRGDFNGDGDNDVAFWVSEKSSGKAGLAVIHSTLDKIYLFGAGSPVPTGEDDKINVGGWMTWFVRQKGTTDTPYNTVPEAGAIEDQPFTFERETIELVIEIGRSGYALYFVEGKYYAIWTVD